MTDPVPRILLVDDSVANLRILLDALEADGYDLAIAEDGPAALRAVAATPPDLILLDIMMPDVDGYEICMIVKQAPRLKGTKVVFLSAKSKTTDIEKGYELGADLYITKPFSTRKLLTQVNELINT